MLMACGHPSVSAAAGSTNGQSAVTSYTGIDPGAGSFYTYAPSTIQTNGTTRYVFYCQNSPSTVVRDHVFLSVGHLQHGRWQYEKPKVMLAPQPGTYYSVHTCEPEVIGGHFHFGGRPERWAMFFTAESVATNSTNQIGLAFANSLDGPWSIDPTPIIRTSDDFGVNNYPNDCPTYPTGHTFYCLGEPTATTVHGRLVLAYMGNTGSPGNASNPTEGVVFRELDLSDVPAHGPCPQCFLTLPNGHKEAAAPLSGIGRPHANGGTGWFHDPPIAYDPVTDEMGVSTDSGPPDSTPNGPPVTPVVTVATIPVKDFLDGRGTWQVQDNFGRCLSGYTDNHNTGIVRSPDGDVPGTGHKITDIYTVADDNLQSDWGVWDYRLWSVNVPLAAHPGHVPSISQASASCPGLDVVGATGKVAVGGSARALGSATASSAGSSVVGMALTPDRQGYYLVTRTGRVLTFGDATDHGSLPKSGGSGVVGIALDATTGGYWIARSDGTVDGFGAPALGDLVTTAATGPVAAITSIPNGEGYYLMTTNGDVSAFGDAVSYGSYVAPPGQRVSAMATTPNGRGYYVVTSSGAIGTFGDATLFGPASVAATSPIVGIAVDLDGFGYWTVAADGKVTAAGDAKATGLTLDGPPRRVVAAVAS